MDRQKDRTVPCERIEDRTSGGRKEETAGTETDPLCL